jgi:hypothetical protein
MSKCHYLKQKLQKLLFITYLAALVDFDYLSERAGKATD